jgi:hypothetical protein
MEKIRIRDKHPGSATLRETTSIWKSIRRFQIKNIAYYAVAGASYLIKPPESTTRQSAFAILYLFSVINYILINLTIFNFQLSPLLQGMRHSRVRELLLFR